VVSCSFQAQSRAATYKVSLAQNGVFATYEDELKIQPQVRQSETAPNYHAVSYFVDGNLPTDISQTLFITAQNTYLLNFYGFGVLNEGSACIFKGKTSRLMTDLMAVNTTQIRC